MVIEAEKNTFPDTGKKLVTIDDARRVFGRLGISPEEVDAKIRYYRQTYSNVLSNDIDAAAVAIDMMASMDPDLRGRFKEIHGVLPSSSEVVKEKAFGGLEIDPKRANLP